MNIFSDDQKFEFGVSIYRNGGHFGPFFHNRLELVILHEGEAQVIVDGISWYLHPGEATLVYNEHSLEYLYAKNKDSHAAWCEIEEPQLPIDAIERIKSLPNKIIPSERMLALQSMGIKLERGQGQNYTNLKNLLGQTVFHEFFYQAKLIEEEKPLPTSVLKAKRFIEKDYTRPCNLKEIAKNANMSPQHLSLLFKKHMKITPIKYLWLIRSEKAVHLLQRTGLTVAEIAYQCGFQNANHFSRYIKIHYGYYPSKLRKSGNLKFI